jgi:transposase
VRVRAKLVQMIRALLLRQDPPDPPVTCLNSPRGLPWLAQCTLDGAAHDALHRVRRSAVHIDTEARAAHAAVVTRAAADPIASALTTLVGIGPVVALTLQAEIGALERFAHWSQLASCAGLVPRVASSGGSTRQGRITREGSPWLRWALVEAAIHAQRRPDATGRWARRLAGRISMCPARVALARVLCRDIHRVRQQTIGA